MEWPKKSKMMLEQRGTFVSPERRKIAIMKAGSIGSEENRDEVRTESQNGIRMKDQKRIKMKSKPSKKGSE